MEKRDRNVFSLVPDFSYISTPIFCILILLAVDFKVTGYSQGQWKGKSMNFLCAGYVRYPYFVRFARIPFTNFIWKHFSDVVLLTFSGMLLYIQIRWCGM